MTQIAEIRKKMRSKIMPRKNAENEKLLYSDLSYQIRGACFELYKELGVGHKETIYHRDYSL